MKAAHVLPLLVMVTLAASMVSVYGNAYTPDIPILGTTGTPALAAPSLFSGLLTVNYANRQPVVLATDQVTLQLCSATSCTPVTATLTLQSPGIYSYSFTPPSGLTGTVTIYVDAGTLADDNGKIFPSVNTAIGTYSAPSSNLASPAAETPTPGSPASLTPQTQPQDVVKQAVNVSQLQLGQTTPVWTVVAALIVLLAAGFLLVIPRRH